MGFYVGHIGNKSVLSLNTETGGAASTHTNPIANTIFHSDMPHVLIEEDYTVNLTDTGYEGYFTAAMPSAIANLISNNPSKVILTEVTFTVGGVEYTYQVRGFSMHTSAVTYGWYYAQNFVTNMTGRVCMSRSGDITIDTGFCSYINNNWSQSLVKGTGGILDACMHASINGGPNVAVGFGCTRQLYGWANNPSKLPLDISKIRPPSGHGGGFTHFFVRASTPLCNATDMSERNNLSSNPNNANYIDPVANLWDFRDLINGIPASAGGTKVTIRPNTDVLLSDQFNTKYETKYAAVPTKVRWLVTNLSYTGSGFTASNPFSGTEIKISSSEFNVKGVDLKNNGVRMINAVTSSTIPSTSSEAISANIFRSTYNYSGSVGALPLALVSKTGAVNTFGGSSTAGWSTAKFSLYDFSNATGWYVNSATNEIGNSSGVYWGPNNVPLKLLTNSSGSITIPEETFTMLDSSGLELHAVLGNYSLGSSSSLPTSVICTIEFLNMSWIYGGTYGGINPLESYANSTQYDNKLTFTANSIPNNYQHQLLMLPINNYVPIQVYRSRLQHAGGSITSPWKDTSNNIVVTPGNITQTYYLRNLGNGNVELSMYVTRDTLVPVKYKTPNMKITVQRLT